MRILETIPFCEVGNGQKFIYKGILFVKKKDSQLITHIDPVHVAPFLFSVEEIKDETGVLTGDVESVNVPIVLETNKDKVLCNVEDVPTQGAFVFNGVPYIKKNKEDLNTFDKDLRSVNGKNLSSLAVNMYTGEGTLFSQGQEVLLPRKITIKIEL